MRKLNRWTAVAVAAVIAVLVGASGATAASLITSKNIKNGTIKLEDMSASAKKAMKSNTGPQGATGPAGAAGAPGANGSQGTQGVQGPAGGFDSAKVDYIAGPTVKVAPGTAGNSVAKCPQGMKVISGGHYFGYANGGVTVELSAPLDDGTGWVAAFGNNGTVEGEATAYAVCAAK